MRDEEPIVITGEVVGVLTKTCKKCKKEQALDRFSKDRSRSDGLSPYCKKCRAAYIKVYAAEHASGLKSYQAGYYQRNKDKLREAHREYDKAHPESVKARRERRKPAQKRTAAEWYQRNKKMISQRQRERVQNDSLFRLKKQIRNMVYGSFTRRGYGKKERAEALLGISLDEFVSYLRGTWKNRYGTEWAGQPCHIDHIIPLATATTEEEVIALNHYTNLQLLTPKDNMEKGGRI